MTITRRSRSTETERLRRLVALQAEQLAGSPVPADGGGDPPPRCSGLAAMASLLTCAGAGVVAPVHTVILTWEGDYIWPTLHCPWDPNDPERPCIIWDGEDKEDAGGKSLPGCGALEWIEAGGWQEAI
ncbi:MAG: hypothetical protein ACYDAD_07910, partial [Acidimicrobiales bacterium]